MPGWTFIAATVLRNLIQTGSVALLMLAIAHFAYGVDVPAGSAGAILLYVVRGTLVFAAVGIATTAAVADVDSGTGLLSFFAFILSFISSIFVPIDQLPSWLAEIARIFPVYHVAQGIQSALAQVGSHVIDSGNLAVLLIWGIGAILIAVRTFRWEPQADR